MEEEEEKTFIHPPTHPCIDSPGDLTGIGEEDGRVGGWRSVGIWIGGEEVEEEGEEEQPTLLERWQGGGV